MSAVGLPTAVERPILGRGPVLLRAPLPPDIEARAAAGRDPEIARMYGGTLPAPQPMDRDAALTWYGTVCADPLRWVIDAHGRAVGTARLHALHEAERRARYAVGLFDPAALGRGIGTTATRLVLCHAFETLRLHRVDLRVLAINARAIRCYEKCGFVREGAEREAARVDGLWVDDLMMSILEDEYRAAVSGWPEVGGR